MKMNIHNRAFMISEPYTFFVYPTIPRNGIKPRGIAIEKPLCIIII